jgi:hypothetical protein
VAEGSVPLILETFTPLPATATPPCENNLVFLLDLTIPDGTAVNPGALIEKSWQVRNDGSCTWSRGYSIRLDSGNPLGILLRHPLPAAQGGEPVELNVQFTAPDEPGSYRSAWRAHDFGGEPFGVLIYIEIVVSE